MKINFVSSQDAGGNKWRNWLMILVLFFAFGGIIVTHIDLSFLEEQIKEKVEESKGLLGGTDTDVNKEVGGDIIFESMAVDIPVLSVSSTPLDPNSFSASRILVKDKESGKVLFRKNEYERHPIASITKLMTALILLEYDIDWTVTTTVIGPDSYDTHMYAGDVYSFEDLWNAMLIGSSNKAALSLVESINGTEDEFVVHMNERAMELGMSDTIFTDVTGIEDGNISTASDLALLIQEVLKHEKISNALLTQEYNLYSKERDEKHHMWNTDWLILDDPNPWIYHSFDKILGGKTGHIAASGFNFIVEVERDGHIIDIIILDAAEHEKRFTEARDVGEWVFDNYVWN